MPEHNALDIQVLKEQRKLYETVLEHTLAGYWDWNIPEGKEYLSPTFKNMFGYQDDEMENSPEAWQRIIFEQDLPNVLQNFNEHVASLGTKPFDSEVRYHHKNGHTVWVRCTGQVIEWDANDAPVRMVGCHIDITELKNKNAQLKRQLNAFAVLNELAANSGLEVNIQIDRALQTGSEFLELELAIVSRIENSEYEIVALQAPSELALSVGQTLDLGNTYCDLVLKSGDVVAINHMNSSEYRSHPCYQTAALETYIGIAIELNGQVFGTVNFSSRKARGRLFSETELLFLRLLARWISGILKRDMDARAIKDREALLQGLFELSPIGIALNDYETGQFIDLNPALLSPTGYSRAEFVSLSYWQITPQEYEVQEQQQLAALETTGRYGPYEKEYIRKDGSRYPVVLYGMVVIDSLGRKLIWSIIEDISERKHTEQLKSEFVSTVSHELRTPLTSIVGALSLMASGKLGDMPVQLKTLLDVAQKNSKQLNFLINDLLDMEKLLAGKMSFDLQVQPLQPLIEQALQNNKAYADHHGVSLVLKTGATATKVAVDRQRLQQVMANLLSNATKFSPESSEVCVLLTSNENYVRVSVQDQGQGIPEEFQGRIFEKFAQADGSAKRQQGGTGLGLAITRELIERMGGRIGFTSEEGKGTTFYFDLPLHR